jgi:hypothetical protein
MRRVLPNTALTPPSHVVQATQVADMGLGGIRTSLMLERAVVAIHALLLDGCARPGE